MKINRKLLPIKAHFFFFMAAMGPILPQLPVLGKNLGISSVVMGFVTGILPFTFLLTKPLFGLMVDVYRKYRKMIFMSLITIMTLSFGLLYFIPTRTSLQFKLNNTEINYLNFCEKDKKISATISLICSSSCLNKSFLAQTDSANDKICVLPNQTLLKNSKCLFICNEESNDDTYLYSSMTFWSFIVFMSVGTIGFNVINSISDAVCFDIVENEFNYGKQRLWGSIGFGVTALISGYLVEFFSKNSPLYIIMLICSILDLFSCVKLELPVITVSSNIFKDLKLVLVNKHVVTFIIFAVLAGIVDSSIIYFIFWYLEDLAIATNTTNIKLIEGLIVAAETLGAEVIFFSLSGKILERIGHVHCFSMCFVNYALRLGLISIAPSPWWILPIEFCMQGPTYALTYTTIVAYANELAPPGASATMQGIAAGMGDGTGYAIGSIVGGLLYKYLGGKWTFRIFTFLALICGGIHFVLHKTILRVHNLGKVVRNGYETID